ncbi:MAG: tetratricopeptide repeat protein, partial [Xanthomonadaceae bacterium]|nr:tetratricopeptide repeat protein [Xanthomonadaceae bacterium]
QAGLAPLSTLEPPGASSGLHIAVRLDPQLAARVRLRGDAVVFVIARVPNGPPMPVAVEKHSVQELPFTAALDDGDGPMPTQRLSSQPVVELVARLSASGNAMPQPDDLESLPVIVRLPTSRTVQLTIGTSRR